MNTTNACQYSQSPDRHSIRGLQDSEAGLQLVSERDLNIKTASCSGGLRFVDRLSWQVLRGSPHSINTTTVH